LQLDESTFDPAVEERGPARIAQARAKLTRRKAVAVVAKRSSVAVARDQNLLLAGLSAPRSGRLRKLKFMGKAQSPHLFNGVCGAVLHFSALGFFFCFW
jgi:hypothetical protein